MGKAVPATYTIEEAARKLASAHLALQAAQAERERAAARELACGRALDDWYGTVCAAAEGPATYVVGVPLVEGGRKRVVVVVREQDEGMGYAVDLMDTVVELGADD